MRAVIRLLRNPWLLGAAGATLAWFNIGVDIAGPDQQLYIPYIRHFAHPELYAGDYIFDSTNYRATLFVPLVGWLHRALGGALEPLLLVEHAVALVLFFSGLAALTARVSRGAAPAWAVAFLSWPPPIPGAAAALWEPSPHPRTLAVAAALWAARFAVDERALPTAALAVAATLIHPLLGGAALLGAALALTRGPRRALVVYLAAVLVALALARLVWPMQQTRLPLLPVAWWLEVATAGLLWLNWHPELRAAAWVALFAVGAWTTRDEPTDRLVRFGLAGLVLLGIALAGMQLRSPLLVSLQLHRGQYVLLAAAVVLTARRLADAHDAGALPLPLFVASAALPLTHSLTVELAGVALALTCSLARPPSWVGRTLAAAMTLVTVLRFRPHREHTRSGGDWVALQRWAAVRSPVGACFLAPFDTPDFRVFSERASVVGAQDENPVIFDREMAEAWKARRHAIDGYAGRSCAALGEAARRWQADFVVAGFDCPLPLVHRQGELRVYAGAKMSPP